MSSAARLMVIDIYCQLIAKLLEDAGQASEPERAARLYAQARDELEFVARNLTQVKDDVANDDRAIA